MTPMCAARPTLASGNPAANSAEAEAVRRFVQGRLPHGAQGAVALETGRTRGRVAEEIEGTKPFSLDVAWAAFGQLTLEDRLRIAAHLCEPLGLVVNVAPLAPLERP